MKQQALLQQTIFELVERLSDAELKLIDYLRLLELRDELDGDRNVPIKAGWVRCRRR